MPSKLFVAGFPYALSETELHEAFSKAGTVMSAKVITDRESGKSRGFGFVEMSTEEEVEAAIEMYNGYDLGGRKVNVSIARPREARPRNDRPRDDRDNDAGGY